MSVSWLKKGADSAKLQQQEEAAADAAYAARDAAYADAARAARAARVAEQRDRFAAMVNAAFAAIGENDA